MKLFYMTGLFFVSLKAYSSAGMYFYYGATDIQTKINNQTILVKEDPTNHFGSILLKNGKTILNTFLGGFTVSNDSRLIADRSGAISYFYDILREKQVCSGHETFISTDYQYCISVLGGSKTLFHIETGTKYDISTEIPTLYANFKTDFIQNPYDLITIDGPWGAILYITLDDFPLHKDGTYRMIEAHNFIVWPNSQIFATQNGFTLADLYDLKSRKKICELKDANLSAFQDKSVPCKYKNYTFQYKPIYLKQIVHEQHVD